MSYSIVAHVTLLQRYFGHLARTLDHPDSCVETLPAVPRVMSSAAMPPAPRWSLRAVIVQPAAGLIYVIPSLQISVGLCLADSVRRMLLFDGEHNGAVRCEEKRIVSICNAVTVGVGRVFSGEGKCVHSFVFINASQRLLGVLPADPFTVVDDRDRLHVVSRRLNGSSPP